jgi:hypothetical protein
LKKLVTFGDSFIAQSRNDSFTPKSWLDYICIENNFRLDGYGSAETGVDNTIVNFLNYDKDFDTCLFVWSDPNREYLPLRNLQTIKDGSWEYISDKEKEIGNKYRKYYSDTMIENIKSVSILQWFDRHLQKQHKNKKFIHLYCFELGDNFYPHIFKQGINIKPELIKFSKLSDFKTSNDDRPLHMATEVHISFANQLNKVLKDKSLSNGDTIEFSLEH